jgi:hypothetical protein
MKTIYGNCGLIGQNYPIGGDSWEYTNLGDFFKTLSDGLFFYFKKVFLVHIVFFGIVFGIIIGSNAIKNQPIFGGNFDKTASKWAVITGPISYIVCIFI